MFLKITFYVSCMKLSFLGAAKTVTGSCYLLEINSQKFLIDCGMFQGKEVEKNNLKFFFDPSEIDFVLLTHAHIDHSGLIPKLYKEGFTGSVYATSETLELTEILLLDSAKIQERLDPKSKRSRKHFGTKKSQYLYDTNDVYSYIEKVKPVKFNEKFLIGNISIKYIRAGHILGAASILVEIDSKRFLFSGDIGRLDQSLIPSYDLLEEEVDIVIMESLYGGELHSKRSSSISKLVKEVNITASGYGNVIIPSFSVHRSQELMLFLQDALKDNRIKNNVKIYLDSPLAIAATKIYTKYLNSYLKNNLISRKSLNGVIGKGNSVLFERVRYVTENFESLRLIRKNKGVILAGSGMCNGGRIVMHLSKGLKKEKNTVVFVGYQAKDTLGREIVQGNEYVKINNRKVRVRAKIVDLKGFSAHGDNRDLLHWIRDKKSDRLKKVFLVHSEIERSQDFKKQLIKENFSVEIPELYSSYSF